MREVAQSAGEFREEEFQLMEFSALDTSWGVFEGDWEETVNEKITVRAAVQVYLEDGRISEIVITDSIHLHPAAARIIPERIIASQRMPVEALSGASVSSWTLMSAVAAALKIDLIELE